MRLFLLGNKSVWETLIYQICHCSTASRETMFSCLKGLCSEEVGVTSAHHSLLQFKQTVPLPPYTINKQFLKVIMLDIIAQAHAPSNF